MERIADPPPFKLSCNITRALQNKGKMAIRIESMGTGQSLIHQEWDIQCRSDVDSSVQSGVFIVSNCMMHPVKHIFTVLSEGMLREGSNSFF